MVFSPIYSQFAIFFCDGPYKCDIVVCGVIDDRMQGDSVSPGFQGSFQDVCVFRICQCKKDVVLLFGSALSTEVCNWATAAGAKISEIANMDALTE